MLEFKPKKSLGQSFLVSRHVAEIEAAHASGKNVLEIGPGLGILTKELCSVAKKVVAVEIDPLLYSNLRHSIRAENLKLLNKDFFKTEAEELELGSTDIMIANIPYKLSSKTIAFLHRHRLQAVLCLQKEFVEHMLAKPGTHKYSKLSVMSQLSFSMTKIADVPRGNFRPVPKVDSSVVYIKPKGEISADEEQMISRIMQHKKKTLRNAVIEALESAGMRRDDASKAAERIAGKTPEERVFKLEPTALLELAKEMRKALEAQKE
ncbi:MAG: 16S rRNA (adenine(1518)-N(6)/adenine(1519)-N(6))-dimethyltransferase RsmA [Candidatus Micrarchaeia archaeon]